VINSHNCTYQSTCLVDVVVTPHLLFGSGGRKGTHLTARRPWYREWVTESATILACGWEAGIGVGRELGFPYKHMVRQRQQERIANRQESGLTHCHDGDQHWEEHVHIT
jgi:hypothetical protein